MSQLTAQRATPTTHAAEDRPRGRAWQRCGAAATRVTAAAVLLGAAGLKAYSVTTAFDPPALTDILLIQAEWLLGCWLLSGLLPRAAWLTAGITFGVFALYNTAQLFRGEPTCACFGPLDTPIWVSLGIDLMLVAGLAWFRPLAAPKPKPEWRRVLVLAITLGGLLASTQLAGGGATNDQFLAQTTTDPPEQSQAPATQPATPPVAALSEPPARQEPAASPRVDTAPAPLDFGYTELGATREGVITVHNPMDTDITILGTKIECVCTEMLDPPQVLPAGQDTIFRIRFEAPELIGKYSKRIRLTTNQPAARHITLTIQAHLGQPLVAEPERIVVGAEPDQESAEAQPLSRTVTVRNESDQPVKLLYATSRIPQWTVAVPAEPVPPKSEVALTVNLGNDAAAPQARSDNIRLHTDHEHQPVLYLPVSVEQTP